jgi:hypothetical protein
MAMAPTGSSASKGSWVEKGLRQVCLNEAPMGPKSASWPVGDKEQATGEAAIATKREAAVLGRGGTIASLAGKRGVAAAAGTEAAGSEMEAELKQWQHC